MHGEWTGESMMHRCGGDQVGVADGRRLSELEKGAKGPVFFGLVLVSSWVIFSQEANFWMT